MAAATAAIFVAALPAAIAGWRVERPDAAGSGVAALSLRQPARPLPQAPALSAPALDSAFGLVEAELERRAFPGAAVAIGAGARTERVGAMGRIGWRHAAPPVSPDSTLYDLASLTKAVATTTAVLLLAEEGKLRLDDPVQPHLPEFEGFLKERVTWRHLLTHTSGLPGGAVIRGEEAHERTRRILRTRLGIPPGRAMVYTDLGFVVLWEAAERVAGEPLTEYLERRVWTPLGMHRTGFLPGQDCTACAPTLRLGTGELYRGRPNDLLARRLGGITGNAGLFSTANDLARFAAMIANDGELEGVRILSPRSVREILTQQPGAGNRTLGWVALCPQEDRAGTRPCDRPIAVGHNGWTGTSLWIHPVSRVWTVLLTNRSYEIRAPERMQPLREGLLREAVSGRVPAGR